ncbi:hypothetical protein SAMN05421747_10884 [Parapedobacter composti]|uniref:Uncharacterized protein n=1 Tax=Parapedobacter composti TaxID=623281 RepID=A0A1I1ID09_9SPHI|nr:hypothetical protein SAMN05421747_10884 [Parapedobacter composti]
MEEKKRAQMPGCISPDGQSSYILLIFKVVSWAKLYKH